MDKEKVIQAATRLEELTVIIKEMTSRLRDGTEDNPYAAVYWLRREIGYVVNTLGEGAPNTGAVELRYTSQETE